MLRLATKAGVVSTCMHASALELVPSSITFESMGLDGILDNNMDSLRMPWGTGRIGCLLDYMQVLPPRHAAKVWSGAGAPEGA